MTGRRTEPGLLTLQARVIAALVLRETRAAFGMSRFGYLWAIVTPAASVGVLVFIFSLIDRQPPFGPSLALFFATGILTLEFFNRLSNTLMTAFAANRALLTYPPIREADALIARLVLISATYALIMLLFFGALIALGLAAIPHAPEHILAAFFCTAALGFGFGALNATVASLWDSWAQIERVLTRPLFFLSGIFYVPSFLPPDAVALLRWNPVLHLVEWGREGWYPTYDSAILDARFPLAVAAGLILAGLAGERLFRKRRVVR